MRLLALALALLVPATASANECKVVELQFAPAEITIPEAMRADSQIVAWIEDQAGNYVETVYITQAVGTYGLGNRPGRFDFNSGPKWPYGRRVTVFPIWAHRRAASGAQIWQELVFQDGNDDNLSHAARESTADLHFCRPQQKNEAAWDAGTCASLVVGTDKGVFTTRPNLYPPRNDISRLQYDSESVDTFAALNPFDAVSSATPPSGMAAEIQWQIPATVPDGNYVLWVEVSREFDHNATYSEAAYPKPTGIPWAEYGEAYRGQPSIVFQMPVSIGPPMFTARTLDYVGYGDPTGMDGTVRPPDATITKGVPGSGADRLAMQSDDGGPYRIKVTSRVEHDSTPPAAPPSIGANTLTRASATIEFTAPGDDGLVGKVRAYEIRYVAGVSIDAFALATELKPAMQIAPGGTMQEFEITGLLFDTDYTVGIRAHDNCGNTGPVATYTFHTPDRGGGEVDACFVATAAYGTVMANDVVLLRALRDRFLSTTVLGELAVEAYYTFGPALAGTIGESELLRATARAMLEPVVAIARRFAN